MQSGAQILGIESEAAAIENAKLNCQLNSIDNCSFFHGRAEDILSSVICKAVNTDIIAVVDPPRAGLRKCPYYSSLNLFMECDDSCGLYSSRSQDLESSLS